MIFNENGDIILSKLDELLKTYYMATGVSIQAINKEGDPLIYYGESINFCKIYDKCVSKVQNCKEFHLNACKQAINIGEAYFFYCPLDFIYVAVPILNSHNFLGGLIVGPIIMNTQSAQFNKKASLNNIESSKISKKLSYYFNLITVADPIRTNYLGNMLFMLASKEMKSYESILKENKKKMHQQCKINEQIQMYKEISSDKNNLHDKEMDLFSKVKSGNIVEAKKVLNDLLALIYFEEGSNLNVVKARIMELCSLLSRAAIEGGAPSREILAFNYLLFEDLNKLHTLEDISLWMLKILDYYTENVISLPSTKNKDIIKKSIIYINNHFRESITLKEVAEHVHMNHSYFSTIFKKETSISFTEYIQKIRIEESKHLLTSTNDSILKIAISVGFDNQSYFTKVFKKITGLTPKQYRLKYSY